jgi:hypothetical protein
MAFESDHGRYQHDPTDPYSQSGMRPHEFPTRGETGLGGLAVAAVLLALFGLFIIVSAFGSNDGVSTEGAAPTAEGTALPPATTGE